MPRLKETLNSVAWADEIIVLDSGSTDNTVEISQQYTDKVYQTDWPGFGVQKQRALDRCSGDWVISIDADEVITDSLRREIQEAIATAPEGTNAFAFPRLSFLCGQPIHHCGWRPDYVPRVFRRTYVVYTDSYVHERPIITGSTERLKHDLIHYSFDSIASLLDKANSYSTLGAQDMQRQGKTSSIWKAIYKGCWAFIRTYFLRRGFLDGKYGFMVSVAHTEGTYYKYLKLAMMNIQDSNKK